MAVDSLGCPLCSLIPGGSVPRGKDPAYRSSVPTAEVHRRSSRFCSTGPAFSRCASVQMLMRSCVAVPAAERRELGAQIMAADDRDAIELLLQCPEEPLDPPVLPRTVRLDALQANAEHSECGLHCRRSLSTRIRRGMPYRRIAWI